MSGAKFTKGPWESFSMGIIGVYIEGRHSWTHIATIGEPYEGSLSEEESNANAHLIEAAPELYEALLRMKQWCEDEVGAELPCSSIDKVLKKAGAL